MYPTKVSPGRERSRRQGGGVSGARFGAARGLRCALLWLALAGAAGCATPPGQRPWGADATLSPGLHRLANAAHAAVTAPATWAPLLAAAGLHAGRFDTRISRWARDHTPVFGSNDAAESASDHLRDGLQAAALLSALSAPGASAPGPWLGAKARGLLVQGAAVEVTSLLTRAGKRASGRTRPNGANDRSFPSGHSSAAAAAARLGSRNVRTLPWSARGFVAADLALAGATAGTAWARVEAGVHYPTDVLAGVALGNLVAAFVHDGFMGLALDYTVVRYDRQRGDTRIELGWRW